MGEKSPVRIQIEEVLEAMKSDQLESLKAGTLEIIANNSSGEEVTKTLEEIRLEKYNESLRIEFEHKPLLNGYDILRYPSQPDDYLIENVLWKGSICMVLGKEKACKSIFTSQEAMEMTHGDTFLGQFDITRPLNVVYAQAEGDIEETKERIVSATSEGGVKWNPGMYFHYHPAAMSLDVHGEPMEVDKHGRVREDSAYTEGSYMDFRNRIVESGVDPDVIIIDPLYMAMEGDLKDDAPVRMFGRNIRKLKKEFNCAIIIVHHEKRPTYDKSNKVNDRGDDGIYGSSMIKNFITHVLRIAIADDKGKEISAFKERGKDIKYRKVTCDTQRNSKVVSEMFLQLQDHPLMLTPVNKSNNILEENIIHYLQTHGESSTKDINDGIGHTKDCSMRTAVCNLRKKDLIISSRKGREAYHKLKEE